MRRLEYLKVQRVVLCLSILFVGSLDLSCGKKSSSTSSTDAATGSLLVTGGSDVNAQVTVTKDSLPPGTTVKVVPGKQLYPQDPTNFTSLAQTKIGDQGDTAIIASNIKQDPGQPLQLQIPLPDSAASGLWLADNATLVVLFKIVDYKKKEIREGVIPRSQFTIKGRQALFNFPYFGEYQVAFAQKVVTKAAELVVNTDIIGRDGKIVISTPTKAKTPTPTPTPLAPLAAKSLSIITGTGNEGDISVTINWGSDRTSNAKAELRAIAGSVAPSDKCTDTADTIVATITDFSSATSSLTFASGSNIGGLFSFRLCITGTDKLLTSSDTVLGVPARDSLAPPTLTSLSGTTGTALLGDISLSWTFPTDTSDYNSMTIQAIAGTSPPADCASGTQIASYTAPFNTTSLTYNTGTVNGDPYSVLVCIKDTTGNLTTISTTNITGRRGLTAVKGTANAGDIQLTIHYPSDVSNYDHIDVYRTQSDTPPSTLCSLDAGDLATTFRTNIIANGTDTALDQTSDVHGNNYSYRACAKDVNDAVVNDSITLSAIASLPAATYTVIPGAVVLTFLLPANTSGYGAFQLFEQQGSTAFDCHGATFPPYPINNITQPFTITTTTTNATHTSGEIWSFTYCVHDNGQFSLIDEIDLLNISVP